VLASIGANAVVKKIQASKAPGPEALADYNRPWNKYRKAVKRELSKQALLAGAFAELDVVFKCAVAEGKRGKLDFTTRKAWSSPAVWL
jgi:hypothetical protein